VLPRQPDRQKLTFKGCNRIIICVTMFGEHKKQCEEANETIF